MGIETLLSISVSPNVLPCWGVVLFFSYNVSHLKSSPSCLFSCSAVTSLRQKSNSWGDHPQPRKTETEQEVKEVRPTETYQHPCIPPPRNLRLLCAHVLLVHQLAGDWHTCPARGAAAEGEAETGQSHPRGHSALQADALPIPSPSGALRG